MSNIPLTTISNIAKVCHEANKAYCETLGDFSQLSWNEAPDWQKESAMNGVSYHLDNPNAGPSGSHENWLKVKVADGWIYGEAKSAELKTHPCIVPYEDLPQEQKNKDYIFVGIVHALSVQGVTA